MNKIDIKKLEDLTREIIETLEEDISEDKSGLLCAKNRNSPFRQLVGLLEMEMDSIRIMYSDLPLPDFAENETVADEPAKTAELPEQVKPFPKPEPTIPKISPRPPGDKPREPGTTSANTVKPKSAPITQQTSGQPTKATAKISPQPAPDSDHTTDQPVTTTARIKTQISPPAETSTKNTRSLIVAGVIILLLFAGLIMLRKEPPAQQPAKVVVNWSDVEKGKSHASEYKDKVTPQSKKQAKSFYTLGKKELGRQNLRAAREYFRTAVSLDPSSDEYMDSYRQVDYMLRKKSTTTQKP